MRIIVSLGVLAAIIFAIDDVQQIGEDYLGRQVKIAIVSCLSYLIVGIVSILIIKINAFKFWMSWVAVTADCAFLFLNGWFSLINSMISGDFIFAMPLVWLAPLVLAFGALRFNPLLQTYVTLLLVSGLSILVSWEPDVLAIDINDRIALAFGAPPNSLRIVLTALLGAMLVVAVQRARWLLRQSIIEAKQKANLFRYLPAQVVETLAEGRLSKLREGQLRDMTILFVDLRGFTKWSEMQDPKTISIFLSEFREIIQHASEKTDAIIDKFIGDGALLLFDGASTAQRAIMCSRLISMNVRMWAHDQAKKYRYSVKVGIGIHHGRVFAGVVGSDTRLEFTALGDAVNTAARLEQLTKEANMAIIASHAVIQAAGSSEESKHWIRLTPVHLHGRQNPLLIYGYKHP